ncbi:MAG: NAD(P)H-hydrate epimerase, partial [Candidatus Neomicrothrix subdominans]
MEPVLTPDEMAAVDAAASERMGDLVQRAGGAVARSALGLLGGGYGRRAHVVAGPGNNGADGRVAAELLRRRGVRVSIGDHADSIPADAALDLVIDAAFGTGLSRPYAPPDLPGDVPVLAVDIP